MAAPEDDNFDFAKYSEAFEQEFSVAPLDIIDQAEEKLRGSVLTAVSRIAFIAEHSQNESNALKASLYIADKVLSKTVEKDVAKALVDRLTADDD